MNEEKTNNAAQQTENPVTTPVEEKTSTTEVSTAAPEAKQVAVATEDKASTQAPAALVTEKTVQPANEAVPQPQVTPQPASEPAPKPQVVPQPAQEDVPAPTQTVNKNDSIIPEVAPQEVAPAAPAGESIKPAPALNVIDNNTQVVKEPEPVTKPPTQTVVAPSNPLNTDIDPNVGFVAVGENLRKKKNVPLIAFITIVLLAGLGALGYFVIYPFAVKQLTKPEKVYNAVIDNAFKELNTTVATISHNKATYTAEVKIDTNVEDLKDLNGFIYTGNFGIDPENKNLQVGVSIKDADSQEHNANIYVKGDREYLRLSSYRELIYLGAVNEYKETWDKLYDVFDDINQKDSEYLVSCFQTLVKNSIVQSKLSKEEASITINGKSYKVLNNKYTIDNDTLTEMYKSILEGLKDDSKAIEILAKNYGIEKDELIKKIDDIKIPEKILKDDAVYYCNIYTHSIKTTVVGVEINDGNNYLRWYSMDGYFEFKINAKQEDVETGKEKLIDLTAIGKKSDGKTNVTVTYNDKEVARFVIKEWNENNKEFTYEIILEDQTLTGEIKLNYEVNNERAKLDFKGSLKIDKDYLNVSLSVTNDWTSEVANVNASTAKTLEDSELQAKIKEFIETLENTPLAKVYTTISGEFDESIFKYRSDTSKDKDNCSPGMNCMEPSGDIEDEPVEEGDHTYHFTEDDSNSI